MTDEDLNAIESVLTQERSADDPHACATILDAVQYLLTEVRRAHRFIGDLGMWHIYSLWFEADDKRKVELIEKSDRAIRPIPILGELSDLRTEVRRLRREIDVDDELLRDRNRILDAIPCPVHGPCVPHVLAEFRHAQDLKANPDCQACGHPVTGHAAKAEQYGITFDWSVGCAVAGCSCRDWGIGAGNAELPSREEGYE